LVRFAGGVEVVSLIALDPGRGAHDTYASFARSLPAALRGAFGAGSDAGLFNAAGRILESPRSGAPLRIESGDRWVEFVAAPPVRRPPDGPGIYCRALTIIGARGAVAQLDACREPSRPVWRFSVAS
jgi:hypothetical protein